MTKRYTVQEATVVLEDGGEVGVFVVLDASDNTDIRICEDIESAAASADQLNRRRGGAARSAHHSALGERESVDIPA